MGALHSFRVWRGDGDGGELADYKVEVNDGEVVLDVIHRLQATQAPDLAVRWNCKAGKCGSCSMEINGKPRLGCMTRMSTFDADETVTITPLRTFPVIRDSGHRRVVQLPEGAGDAGLRPTGRTGAGRVPDAADRRRSLAGVPQVHRVLPLPEHMPRGARPRGQQARVFGPAPVHPGRRARHAPARRSRRPQGVRATRSRALATATSPSAAPKFARSTSRSLTTRSSR